MRLETAGDPISGLKWTHKATEKIAKELRRLGIHVGKSTVGRLLKQLNFSLRVNHKKRSHGSSPATRDLQFRYIRRLRTTFARRDDPIISVDANYDPARIMDTGSGEVCGSPRADKRPAALLIRHMYT